MAPEPDDHAPGDDLCLTAERITRLLGGVDAADDLGLDAGIENTDFGAV
jgi:hypothetical protein